MSRPAARRASPSGGTRLGHRIVVCCPCGARAALAGVTLKKSRFTYLVNGGFRARTASTRQTDAHHAGIRAGRPGREQSPS